MFVRFLFTKIVELNFFSQLHLFLKMSTSSATNPAWSAAFQASQDPSILQSGYHLKKDWESSIKEFATIIPKEKSQFPFDVWRFDKYSFHPQSAYIFFPVLATKVYDWNADKWTEKATAGTRFIIQKMVEKELIHPLPPCFRINSDPKKGRSNSARERKCSIGMKCGVHPSCPARYTIHFSLPANTEKNLCTECW